MTVSGSCLCEAVMFEISGEIPNFYQCHCGQCRKVTGSASNTGIFLSKGQMRWISGEDKVTAFVKDSGYNSSFCSLCGSALPNPSRGGGGYWVPAGSLDGEIDSRVAVHLHVDSKALWDFIGDDGEQYAAMPDLHILSKALQRKDCEE